MNTNYKAAAKQARAGKWGKAALVSVVYVLLSYAVNAIPGIGSMVSLLISGPLTLSVYMIALRIIRGEEFEVSNLFDGFSNFTNAFSLYLVNNIFIALWSMLFVIPGIVKSYAYSMSYFILADHPEMSQSDARKASIEMMKGHKWELFCLQFSFIGWYLLTIITCGILTFWVTPYVDAATAAFYENLKNN